MYLVITCIINASLSTSVLPWSRKHVIVTPALRRQGTNVNVLSNFHVIIIVVLKTMQLLVSRQLAYWTCTRVPTSTNLGCLKDCQVWAVVRKCQWLRWQCAVSQTMS